MCGIIYKITNKINGKVYIGLTTVPLKIRWNGHKTSARKAMRGEKNHPLYNAMSKYGIENFTIEEIAKTDNFVELGNLEREYIKKYNSTNRDFGYNITRGGESNQLDGNPRANLTVEDVKRIRKVYSECTVGPLELWKNDYKDKISYSAFEKVYEGKTWTTISPEIYTLENKEKHRKMTANPGEKNGNAILSREEVYEIRKYYVNHSLRECYEKYGGKFSSINTFRCVIDKSYTDIPRYSRAKKKWFYEDIEKRNIYKKNDIRINGDLIEIDTFNDYGEKNGTFVTDAVYVDIVREHKWSKFGNGKIYTNIGNRSIKFLHDFIMDGKGRVYFINGDYSDVRKENLTHSLVEHKIKNFGIERFLTLCLDEGISVRKMGKEIGVSANGLIRYIQNNGIQVSKNKSKNGD